MVGAPGEPGFQFTYLSAEGKDKAAIDKEDQRRTLGSNKGGVVFLTDDIRPGATWLVGEGVDDAFADKQGRAGLYIVGQKDDAAFVGPEGAALIFFVDRGLAFAVGGKIRDLK